MVMGTLLVAGTPLGMRWRVCVYVHGELLELGEVGIVLVVLRKR